TRPIAFVASHPERGSSLAICDGYSRTARSNDYPYGPTVEELRQRHDRILASWGTTDPPRHVDADRALGDCTSRSRRYAPSPGVARKLFEVVRRIDVRHSLGAIRAPALVIRHEGGALTDADHGRYLGAHIPRAAYVELPGRALIEWRFPDPDAVA